MSFYPYAAYHLTQSGGKALFLLPAKLNDSGAEAFQFLRIDAADRAKVGAGVIMRRNEAIATPHNNQYFAGVSYDVRPDVNLAAEAYYLDYRHSSNKAWLGAVRAMYLLSKRTSVYLTAGYVDNSGQLNMSVSAGATGANPVAGGNQFGVTAGIKQAF